MRFATRFASCLASSVLVLCAPSFAEPIAIGGQVTADGQPAAGAKVTLVPALGRYATGQLRLAGKPDPEPEAETLSGAEGRFRLEAPRSGLWKVHFELDGWVPRELRLEPLLHATELGAVELESDAELRVRLTAGGEPVAARVVGYPIDPTMSRMAGRRVPLFEAGGWRRPLFTGTADERGGVRLPASGEEKTWVLEVAAADLAPLVYESPARRSVELALRPGARREIETVDAGGEPLAGVLLFLEDGYLPLAITGGRGRATLAVPADSDLRLTAIDPSGRHGASRLEPPDDSSDALAVTLVLEEPRTISGRVVEQGSGAPIAGALVWAGTVETARTDAEGGYSVRLPAPGGSWRIPVQASAAGYASGRETVSPSGPAGPTITLRPAASLGGRVVDADSAALAGVEIEVSRLQRGRRRGPRRPGEDKRRARTGKDGRFEVSGLAAGEGYRLRLVKAGFAPGKLEVENLEPFEQRSGLEAVLHRGGRAIGLVVDEQEVPVAGAMVRLEEPAGPRRRVFKMPGTEDRAPRDTTGVDGGFAIPDLAAGSYDLKVESPGFGPVAVPGVEVPAGAGEVDLGTVVLPPGVAIEGRVTGAEGRPLAGIEIRASEPTRFPMPAALQMMMLAQQTPVITGVDGRFAVPDRRAGERLDLVVAGEGYVAITVSGVMAPPEEPLEIVLQQASRVSGRVLDAGGEPIAGADVEARPEGLAGSGGGPMSSFNRARTDADGGFELVDVDPGLVTVVASAAGFQETQLSGLEAAAGGELRDVELTLRPGAVLRGTVLDAGGKPVADARVWVSATGDERPEGFAATDGDGRFEISGVRPGRRTVSASDQRGQQVAQSLEVEAGAQSVELRFAGGVEVSGRVLDVTGLGVAGADAELALTTLPGEAAEGVDVLLTATAGLSFEVASAAGVAPSRVDVSLLDDAGRWIAGGSYPTLQGGRVEITTVPDGSWEMLIAAGASATSSLRVSAPGDAGRVQLSAGGGVRVEVPELAGGSVAAGLTITGPDGRPHRGVLPGGGGVATYALRAGRVTVSNLAPGPWTVTVTAGERSWSAGVLVTPGEPVEVTLR